MMLTANNAIKVLIVDNEKKACNNLKNMLLEFVDSEIDIVGVCYSTLDAEEKINALKPDAVFLDIQMPYENAFHFLDRISPIDFEVIFVTAYDDYAVRAFRLNALDYILKPISVSELESAVKKLKEKVRYKKVFASKIISYSEVSDQVNKKLKIHKIRTDESEVIEFSEICFIEAQSSYSKICFFNNGTLQEIVMSYPLSDYEELLPDDIFYRIHRSYLINCAQLKEISGESSSQVILRNDITLPVSRRRFSSLLEFLKTNNYL